VQRSDNCVKQGILILCAFLSFISAYPADKVIQCITNFPIDAESYTHALKRHGYDAKVVVVDIKEYEEALLKKKGFFNKILRKLSFSEIAVPENVEKIVFFNITPKVARKYDLSKLPKDKLVLFMWEPKTVLCRMYLPKIRNCFSQIYTWDDSLVDGKTHFKFYYPVLLPMIEEIVPFEEKKLCTLVASNLKSHFKNELYSERKKAIRFFEQIGEEGFEFYGRRWDPLEYPSYRGMISDKIGTIKNYRFNICYENTKETPGYITEKIFDCFAAGTVPIYWGASNIDEYIPMDCFIDRNAFNSMEELYRFIKAMSKEDYEGYLARIRTFLTSDIAKRFTMDQLGEDFYRSVN
jgi:alpha(1,3/1,4) fucosyltransferase